MIRYITIIHFAFFLSFCLRAQSAPKKIWRPGPGTSWQWQLNGTLDLDLNVEMYDIDLFDTSKEQIQSLKDQGIAVVCYFSAGSYENWRPDRQKFPRKLYGRKLDGWAGEKWLDIRQVDSLRKIMGERMDLAVQKGCDGVEPDNIDGFTNRSGFPLKSEHQLAYNKMLADEAHKRGLSIGLKNDVSQIKELEPYFDWALNEQCFQYQECEGYRHFIDNGKAVFGVEYELTPEKFCEKANEMNMDWLYKKYDLKNFRVSCR